MLAGAAAAAWLLINRVREAKSTARERVGAPHPAAAAAAAIAS